MRITIVLPFVNRTGGIRILLDFANWLHEHDHRVTVVYPLWPYRYHFSRRDQYREFARERRREPGVDWLALRCPLRRVPWIANRFLPRGDVVLATSWPVAHDVAALDRSRGRKVHIVFHHESGTGPEDRIAASYRLPFHRLTLSRFVRDSVARRFDCEIHDVVPAGVDTTLFFPDGERAPDTVLMLYHNDPRKGADDGIQALTQLRARHPSVRVRLGGTVMPAGLPSWIDFDFHPPDAALRRCYSSSTIFLYPSRYEGFGLPPLESMACGCPVVTTAVGAVPEFAEDRRNALVVPPGDVAGLTDRLEEALLNPQLRCELSTRGLETAANYALNRVAPRFVEALSSGADPRGWRQSRGV